MPVVIGLAYVIGLMALGGLAYSAGQKKSQRGGTVGGDFEPLFDPRSKYWFIILLRERTGKRAYVWTKPKYLNFSEQIDYSMSIDKSRYDKHESMLWNGRQWTPEYETGTIDPRYGRLASR
jgi:hypothetical protein